MAVIGATWADLGFRKLGPTSRLEATTTARLADVIRGYGYHDVESAGNERWIRDKARKIGAMVKPVLRKVGSITADNCDDAGAYTFADDVAASEYGRVSIPNSTLPADRLVALTKPQEDEAPWRTLYRLGLAVGFCPPSDLATFLRYHVVPVFLQAYPGGRVVAIRSEYEFERRQGMLRGIYSLSHFKATELRSDEGLAALRDWHIVDSLHAPALVGAIVGIAFYPLMHVVNAGPRGVRLFFVLDPAVEHYLPPFPSDWVSEVIGPSDFAQQKREDLGELVANAEKQWGAAHRRWRQQRRFSGSEIESFIEWLAARYSELAFHAGDPCEFTEDGCVDGVTAMEYGLTLDRVLRRSVSCVASDSVAERKMAAFEIADLLEELRAVWDPTLTSTTFFKVLHHPERGRDLVKEALSTLPSPFAGYFQETTDQIYGELQTSVLASVWIKSKLTAQGVLVKGRDLRKEHLEPFPEFVANTVRALRNGHHGYLTKRDRSQRPSRYLSLVTGNVPDSLSYLGLLWALALLSAPKKLLAWDWMPVNAWP